MLSISANYYELFRENVVWEFWHYLQATEVDKVEFPSCAD